MFKRNQLIKISGFLLTLAISVSSINSFAIIGEPQLPEKLKKH